MATRGMPGIGDDAAGEANRELAADEAALLTRTKMDLASLKPKIGDKAAFDKLVEAVQASTDKNESVAAFQARLKSLGDDVVKVAKTVVGLVK